MNRLKKVFAVIAVIIINIFVFGILPLNILLIWKDFPQWIMIIAAVTDTALALLIAKKAFNGKAAKRITVIITGIFAAMCILLAYACPYWNSDGYKSGRPKNYYENSNLTQKDALNMLEEVMEYLRKYHVSFADGLSPEVLAKYDEVRVYLESKDTVTRIEFVRGVKSILHEFHDAHTTFNSWDPVLLSDGFVRSGTKSRYCRLDDHCIILKNQKKAF